MISINAPQSFDWTVRNLHKAFNEWLEEGNLFFEFQKFEEEGRDSATKAAKFWKEKKKFVYLFICQNRRNNEGRTYQPCQQKKSDSLSHGCEWEGTTNFKL